MLLKRNYHHDPNGIKAPAVSGVVIKRLCSNGKQHFSPKLVKTGISEGWLTKTDEAIIIHDDDVGDIPFKILRGPGRYCCHCQEKLKDDPTGEAARQHVEEKHKGKKSPDPRHPAGYEMINYYDCELEK